MGLMDKFRPAHNGVPGAYRGSHVQSRIGDKLPAYLTGGQPPTDPTDPTGAPVDLRKAAKISVLKRPTFAGRQFAFYLMGDMSGSMRGYIEDGSLDYLTEAILVIIDENRWDSDGVIPCIPYATSASGAVEVRLGQHRGAAARMRQYGEQNGIGWGTQYHWGIDAMVTHYQSSPDWNKRPAICVLQSDGLDNDPRTTARKLTAYSKLPIHFVLVYFGDVDPDGNDEARSMRALDKGTSMTGRMTDNVSLFIAGPEPKRVTPLELYDGLLEGPAQWLRDAPRDGVWLP